MVQSAGVNSHPIQLSPSNSGIGNGSEENVLSVGGRLSQQEVIGTEVDAVPNFSDNNRAANDNRAPSESSVSLSDLEDDPSVAEDLMKGAKAGGTWLLGASPYLAGAGIAIAKNMLDIIQEVPESGWGEAISSNVKEATMVAVPLTALAAVGGYQTGKLMLSAGEGLYKLVIPQDIQDVLPRLASKGASAGMAVASEGLKGTAQLAKGAMNLAKEAPTELPRLLIQAGVKLAGFSNEATDAARNEYKQATQAEPRFKLARQEAAQAAKIK